MVRTCRVPSRRSVREVIMPKQILSDAFRTVWSARWRIGTTLLVFSLFVGVLANTVSAKTVYIVSDSEQTAPLDAYDETSHDLLVQAGIQADVSGETGVLGASSSQLIVNRSQVVTVKYNGAASSIMANTNETVSSILSRLGIDVSSRDIVSVDIGDTAESGMVISVTRKMIYYQQVSETLGYDTQRVADPSVPLGTETVTQSGTAGSKTCTYEIVYEDGEEISRQLVNEAVAVEPVDEIVTYGTRALKIGFSDPIKSVSAFAGGGGIITTSSGATIQFSDAITCTATAYTTEGKSWKTTSTGTTARYGAIAVDPTVIPYGTKMYIVSNDGRYIYGIAVAEDCGGSIKGKKIDLFFDTYDECITFGRRDCTVYILN